MNIRHTKATARIGAALLQCIIAASLVFASLPAIAVADDDLPTRVGRVADVTGELYLASESATDWAPIGQNYPVTQNDRLWAAPEARAELDFGTGQLRLAGDTQVQISVLDEHRFALFVASGRVIVRLRTLEPEDSAVVDTPQAQIRIRAGTYRIEVARDGQATEVAVREGEADLSLQAGMQQVLPGQTATIAASDSARVIFGNDVSGDAFDAWSSGRDRLYDGYRSGRYVAPEMVGAIDLDAYGTWESYSTYGSVWFPMVVAVGWAPYRFGHWVWCGPWGWTWVDDAPWGYAPFHYGRWIYLAGRWGWCPGAFRHRPAWAPALVAWFGGQGWMSTGSVFAWVPLAWGEPLRPHWRCSEKCRRGLNQPVAAEEDGRERVRHRYANSDVPGGVTAVIAQAMAEGKSVAANVVRIPRPAMATAPLLDAPAIAPAPIVSARQRFDRSTEISRRAHPSTPMTAPAVPVPLQAGRLVNTPPTSEAASPQRNAPGVAPRMYGGVPDARGAYTGVAPTPGPKLPAGPEGAYAPTLRAPREALPRATGAPAAPVIPQPTAPPTLTGPLPAGARESTTRTQSHPGATTPGPGTPPPK